jgi:hypothetical protein
VGCWSRRRTATACNLASSEAPSHSRCGLSAAAARSGDGEAHRGACRRIHFWDWRRCWWCCRQRSGVARDAAGRSVLK